MIIQRGRKDCSPFAREWISMSSNPFAPALSEICNVSLFIPWLSLLASVIIPSMSWDLGRYSTRPRSVKNSAKEARANTLPFDVNLDLGPLLQRIYLWVASAGIDQSDCIVYRWYSSSITLLKYDYFIVTARITKASSISRPSTKE